MKTPLTTQRPMLQSESARPKPDPRSEAAVGGGSLSAPVQAHSVKAPVDVKDVFATATGQTLQCGSLKALVQLQESGKLDQVRKNGAQNLGLLKGLMDDLVKTYQQNGMASVAAPKNHWVGDIEGRDNNGLKSLIDAGALTCDPDGGNAKLTEQNARLVFQGDIGDRGAIGMWARKVLTSLKTSNPEGVDIIWGNRCAAKLGLLNDLEGMQKLTDKGYRAHLMKQPGVDGSPASLKAANTVSVQVEYWPATHGARNELQYHQQELQQIQGKPVTLE
jgi:hypothetical protein